MKFLNSEQQVKRDFMIDRRNFRDVNFRRKTKRKSKEDLPMPCSDKYNWMKKFSDTSNFKAVLNWYIRVVALNSTLRVYAQWLIRIDYPLIYQDPPQHITVDHFLNYCADTLAVLEQLKKSKREKVETIFNQCSFEWYHYSTTTDVRLPKNWKPVGKAVWHYKKN